MKENVIIYGVGEFYKTHESEALQKYNVIGYCDKNQSGIIHEKEIMKPNQLLQYGNEKILIMISNMKYIMDVSKYLVLDNGISPEQLLYGYCEFDQMSKLERMECLKDSELRYKVTINGISCEVSTIDEYNNVEEVLFVENYYFHIANGKKNIVLDIGLNIGSASLYFINKIKNIEKIYGYEPFEKTFYAAHNNLKEYIGNGDTIEIFNYGLSDVNERRQIVFNPNVTCAQSSIIQNTLKAQKQYVDWGLADDTENEIVEIEVRKASDILSAIVDKHSDCNIILKIDCEGEEYGIFADLEQYGLFSKIYMIMLEWHYRGREKLTEILNRNQFNYWCFNKSREMGLIYAQK